MGRVSKDGDAPRMNANMEGAQRYADRDEMLPDRLNAMLGMTFEGCHWTSPPEFAFRGYVARSGELMLGVNRDVHDGMHPWERNLSAHLARIVIGEVQVPAIAEPLLPALHMALLEHDGFSPNGAEAVARCLGRVALDAGSRRHVLKFEEGRPRSGTFITEEWAQLQVTLGEGEVASKRGIVIRNRLSDTVVAALPGRRVTDIVDHPALVGWRIASVDTRRSGHTVVVERGCAS